MQEADGRARSVLALFETQDALVKTVKNGDWLGMVWQLARGERTSLSLPPPRGAGMLLFGRVSSGSVGLIWDRGQLEAQLASAYVWPSGYNAKTEHNLLTDERSGEVSLVGGREAHLVSIEALRGANCEHEAECHAARGWRSSTYDELHPDEVMPGSSYGRSSRISPPPPLGHNEISLRLSPGCAGIVGLFVRSSQAHHLLLALGVRSLLSHVFPALAHPAELPLLRLTSTDGASEVTREEMLDALRGVASDAPVPAATAPAPATAAATAAPATAATAGSATIGAAPLSSTPRLPIDTSFFPELSLSETLRLHARLGISRDSLRRALAGMETARRDGACCELCRSTSLLLSSCALQRNAASAREVVRASAPLMNPGLATGSPLLPPPSRELNDEQCGGEASKAAGRCEAADELTEEVPGRSPVPASSEMMVALGAQVALRELTAGRTARRLATACAELGDWLQRAESRMWGCSGLVFLCRSWHETRQVCISRPLHLPLISPAPLLHLPCMPSHPRCICISPAS